MHVCTHTQEFTPVKAKLRKAGITYRLSHPANLRLTSFSLLPLHTPSGHQQVWKISLLNGFDPPQREKLNKTRRCRFCVRCVDPSHKTACMLLFTVQSFFLYYVYIFSRRVKTAAHLLSFICDELASTVHTRSTFTLCSLCWTIKCLKSFQLLCSELLEHSA